MPDYMRISVLILLSIFGYAAKAQFYAPSNSGSSNNANVGIDTQLPVEKFQIGDRWTFHNGGSKVIGYNSYFSGSDKRIVDDESSSFRFTGSGDISFQTAAFGSANSSISWNVPLFLSNAGKVGIGTINPVHKLSLYDISQTPVINITGSGGLNQTIAELRLTNYYESLAGHRASIKAISDNSGSAGYVAMQFNTSIYNGSHLEIEAMRIASNGNIGIGTVSPTHKLSLYDVTQTPVVNITGSGGLNQIIAELRLTNSYESLAGHRASIKAISDNSGSAGYVAMQFNTSVYNGSHTEIEAVRIASNGNVGIGTTTPDQRLTVDGTVKCEEVKVEIIPGTGPDYVFEKNYDLLPLSELETYITQNKHLPEVPSAKEMEAEGLNLKEMNLLLLKKVEELTLHLIEQEKKMLTHDERFQVLNERIETQKKEIESLTKK
jgi:hypothetical protein